MAGIKEYGKIIDSKMMEKWRVASGERADQRPGQDMGNTLEAFGNWS
jgi:hypothetical protein